MTGANSATLTLTAPSSGVYVFRLQVTDNAGNTDSDYVTVNVSSNSPPVANAGVDRVITLPEASVTIQGSGTDRNGTITSYSWAKIAGGNLSLSGQTTPTLTASSMTAGTYLFRLTVTDNQGATHLDDVKVTVNNPPKVFAGSDISITLPTNSVNIQGTSSDIDGTIISYNWQMLSGKSATLNGANTATLSATGLTEGSYLFRFTVKDNLGASRSDDIAVTVIASSDNNVISNAVPVANAGPDKVIHLPTNSISISGSGTDTDGMITVYTWTKISGGKATLSNANTSTLTASGLAAGSYLFRLAVKDNNGAIDLDDVKVVVNQPPTVSAGADIKITLPDNSIKLAGTASDADGTIASYQWTMPSGTVATLSNTTTSTLSASGLVAGNYVFRFTVKDNFGASKSDDVMVHVQDPTSTTNYGNADAAEIGGDESTSKFNLAQDEEFWTDKTVSIFDATGKEIFSGRWQPDNYNEILRHGLFVVNVHFAGKIIQQQKLYKLK